MEKSAEERVEELTKENNLLRKLVACSSLPCVYCPLSAADMAKCQSGFPGCGRADDMMLEVELIDPNFLERFIPPKEERFGINFGNMPIHDVMHNMEWEDPNLRSGSR